MTSLLTATVAAGHTFVLGAAGNPLDTKYFDLSSYWDLLIAGVILLIGWTALKAAHHGAKKGEPAHLGKYAACAIIALGILFIAAHVVSISNSESFNEVGCSAKLTCDKAATTPTTTR